MGTQGKSSGSWAGFTGAIPRGASLFMATRPRQWIKNGLVFLPFLFAVRIAWAPDNLSPVPDILFRLLLIFLAFCALASSTYLLNDVMDREADRRHPAKRNRPIAAGRVSVGLAVAAMIVLSGGGLVLMVLVKPVLGAIGVLYLGMNAAYSLGVKRVVLLDIFIVASGYVIRTTVGAIAIDVTPSPWLYVATGAGALFTVLGRRYAEVRLAGDSAAEQRGVLSEYSGPLIGQLLSISAVGAWLSYTVYTVEAEGLPGNDTMLLTVPIVTFGLFRYLYLLNNSREAEAPEQLITRDLPMVAAIACWVALSGLVLLLYG